MRVRDRDLRRTKPCLTIDGPNEQEWSGSPALRSPVEHANLAPVNRTTLILSMMLVAACLLACGKRACGAEAGKEGEPVAGLGDMVPPTLAVRCAAVFKTADSVPVTYVIHNGTASEMNICHMLDIWKFTVTLVTPSGTKLGGGSMGGVVSGGPLRDWVTIAPGGEKGLSVDLADWFPFDEVGEYRGILTKGVNWGKDFVVGPRNQGTPVELAAEFKFRIESTATTHKRESLMFAPRVPHHEPSFWSNVVDEVPAYCREHCPRVVGAGLAVVAGVAWLWMRRGRSLLGNDRFN